MERLLQDHDLLLIEASVVERLRRSGHVELHPRLVHAHLLYDEAGRNALQTIYNSYIAIAKEAGLPLLLCTPTWRANHERVEEADAGPDINRDAVDFMNALLRSEKEAGPTIKIGGLIGCKNDCYRPGEGLSMDEAEAFHAWQIEHLARAGADFLIAETLPNTHEAAGIAKAMAKTGVPYIISFVIGRNGCVLDGIPLAEAIDVVDGALDNRPEGFMVNCAHPTFLNAEDQPPQLFHRLIGYQANASSLDHSDLEGAGDLHMDDVSEWGNKMLSLNREYGLKILGGCCGTGIEHLRYLATGA